MGKVNHGGSAFPWEYESGMSLRDYLAGQAINGLLSRDSKEGGWSGPEGVIRVSRFAYEYADAMIAERNKK